MNNKIVIYSCLIYSLQVEAIEFHIDLYAKTVKKI